MRWISHDVSPECVQPDRLWLSSKLRNGHKPLNLNTATKEQLQSLPEITSTEADRVIADRPYHDPQELVSRHMLPKSKYDRIADLVKAK